jgi:Cu/Ag efflux protein CusF
MKAVVRIGLTCVASFALTFAVWTATPGSGNALAAETVTNAQTAQAPATPQSISGKIASVDKSSFTLTVASGSISDVTISESQSAAKSMTFQVDQNTTIDGKLKVGANADVTYRQEGANNIAISVRLS